MVKRGEIWWAELSRPSNSEPGYRRPVVIIQADSFNESRINTVICAVLSSNLKLKDAPGNIHLTAKTTGLPKDSVLNVSQIITLDKTFLQEKAGSLSRKKEILLNEGLRLVLELNTVMKED